MAKTTKPRPLPVKRRMLAHRGKWRTGELYPDDAQNRRAFTLMLGENSYDEVLVTITPLRAKRGAK